MVDGSRIVANDFIYESDLPVQIECLLENAGPPEPLTLQLLTNHTDDDLLISNPPRDPSTCTWTFDDGLSHLVTDISKSVSTCFARVVPISTLTKQITR